MLLAVKYAPRYHFVELRLLELALEFLVNPTLKPHSLMMLIDFVFNVFDFLFVQEFFNFISLITSSDFFYFKV